MDQPQEYIVKSRMPSVAYPDMTMSEFLAKQISSHDPTLPAIINAHDGTEISFSDLHVLIQKRALGLVENGIVKSDLIMFFAANSVDYLVSMLSLIYLGVTLTPLKPASGVYELVNQIRDSKGSVIVTDCQRMDILKRAMEDPQNGPVIKQIKLVIILDSFDGKTLFSEHPMAPKRVMTLDEVVSEKTHLDRIPYFETSKEDALVVLYTSGTTGQPKGAIHSQKSFLSVMFAFKSVAPNQLPFRYMWWIPFGHVSGYYGVMINLCGGVTTVIQPIPLTKHLLASTEKFKVNQFPIALAHAMEMVKNDYQNEFDLRSLKMLSFGGSKIPEHLLSKIREKYQVKIFELYATTEMFASVLPIGDNPPGSVGILCPNNQMKVIDLKTGKSLPPCEHGEICFKGPSQFAGYLYNENATKETIDEDGWYHTGDIGYYDQDGRLYFVDRIKEMIKFKHWSVSPVEIEVFLQSHPAVDNVCVVGVKHQTDGYWVRAYVQVRKDHQVDDLELKQYVQDNLGFHKRIRAGVEFVEQIMRTPVGKVDRKYYHQLVANELLIEVEQEQ